MKYRAKVELWDEKEMRVGVVWTPEIPSDAPLTEWRHQTRHLWAALWRLIRARAG